MRRVLPEVLRKYKPEPWQRMFVLIPVYITHWSKEHGRDVTEKVWWEYVEARWIPIYYNENWQRCGGFFEYRFPEEQQCT